MEDEEFRGFFPGSKKPLPVALEPRAEEREETPWDNHPVQKIVKGRAVDFFTVGALAQALNKSVVSIRLWIKNGNIPEATYRMPDRGDIRGRRLYTREQIEALLTLARQHGIVDGKRVDWRKHSSLADEVRQAWKKLPTP